MRQKWKDIKVIPECCWELRLICRFSGNGWTCNKKVKNRFSSGFQQVFGDRLILQGEMTPIHRTFHLSESRWEILYDVLVCGFSDSIDNKLQ